MVQKLYGLRFLGGIIVVIEIQREFPVVRSSNCEL